MILPSNCDDALAEARRKIDQMLLTHHDGDLYLALGWTDIDADDLAPHQFGNKWREVSQAVSRDKRRRFGHLSPEQMMQTVFAPRGFPEHDERAKRYQERTELNTDAEDDDIVSDFSRSLNNFGRSLKDAEYIVFAEIDTREKPASTFCAGLQELGCAIAIIDDNDEMDNISHAKRAFLQGIKSLPNQSDAEAIARRLGCPVARQFQPLVNVTPSTDENRTATFTELQAASQGLKRLGVLRMDVDNLGDLFANGFRTPDGQSRASLLRVAGLSFSLSLFFEGYVGLLCEELNHEYRADVPADVPDEDTDKQTQVEVEAVYTVYSGGDDLFIVGRWDVMPILAQRIAQDFQRYGCDNPLVHISGGLTLHGGKYPLYQAAENAESALDDAKDLDNKNAMTFLGQSVKWEQRWQDVIELRDAIMELVTDDKIGRNLLQVLLQLHADYDKARDEYSKHDAPQTRTEQPQLVWGAWLWRSAYQLSQLAGRATHRQAQIEQLQQWLKDDDFRGIEVVGLAARWVHALTRVEKQGEYDGTK